MSGAKDKLSGIHPVRANPDQKRIIVPDRRCWSGVNVAGNRAQSNKYGTSVEWTRSVGA